MTRRQTIVPICTSGMQKRAEELLTVTERGNKQSSPCKNSDYVLNSFYPFNSFKKKSRATKNTYMYMQLNLIHVEVIRRSCQSHCISVKVIKRSVKYLCKSLHHSNNHAALKTD